MLVKIHEDYDPPLVIKLLGIVLLLFAAFLFVIGPVLYLAGVR